MYFVGYNGEFSGFDSKEEALDQAKDWAKYDRENIQIFQGEEIGLVYMPNEPMVTWHGKEE